LLTGIVSIVCQVVAAAAEDPSAIAMLLMVVVALASLALVLPSLAVTVRRLHDTDRSGWFVLITLIRSSARSCCSWDVRARHRGPEPLRSGSDPGCLSGAGRPGGRFRAGWAPARAGANTQTNAGAVIRSLAQA
jgi:hypothetical protein